MCERYVIRHLQRLDGEDMNFRPADELHQITVNTLRAELLANAMLNKALNGSFYIEKAGELTPQEKEELERLGYNVVIQRCDDSTVWTIIKW